MIKRLTFVRRAEGIAPGEFRERWRDAALTADNSAPDHARHRRLVHCVVRPGRTDRAYHGVAIEWFSDERAAAASDGFAAGALSDVVDLSAVVQVWVDSRTVFGDDQLRSWWDDIGTDPRLLLIGVIQRSPRLTREQFASYWWDEHRPLANQLLPAELQPDIYVHDYVRPGEAARFDGVGEFYDASVDVARDRTRWTERASAPETEAIAADEERFLIRATRWALVTDAEVVICTR